MITFSKADPKTANFRASICGILLGHIGSLCTLLSGSRRPVFSANYRPIWHHGVSKSERIPGIFGVSWKPLTVIAPCHLSHHVTTFFVPNHALNLEVVSNTLFNHVIP